MFKVVVGQLQEAATQLLVINPVETPRSNQLSNKFICFFGGDHL